MPDPQRLYDFMNRTQKHLQFALDSGDQAGVDQYEQMLDRANSLGERLLNNQGAIAPSGPMPVSVDNQEPMPYDQHMAQRQPPPADANYMAGDEPTQQNTSGASPQPYMGKVDTLVPLPALQKTPTNLTLDLEQEAGPVNSPFAKPQSTNPIQKAMDTYGSAPPSGGGGLTVPPSSTPAPNPWNYMGQAIQPSGEGGLPNLPSSIQALLQTSQVPGGLISQVPGVNAPGGVKPVPDKQIQAAWEAENRAYGVPNIPPMSPEMSGDIAANAAAKIAPEPATMGSRYDIDPTFRERLDNMGKYGMSQADQQAHAAEFDRKKEFEKRVLEEHGKPPSFIEQLLSMLLGGMRGLGHTIEGKQRYQAGRAAVGKEMRGEVATKQRYAYTQDRDKLNRELEAKKASMVLLGKSVGMAQKPHLVEAERASAQIDTLLRTPGIAESDPRIQKLQAQMAAALAAADEVSQSNLYDRNILR